MQNKKTYGLWVALLLPVAWFLMVIENGPSRAPGPLLEVAKALHGNSLVLLLVQLITVLSAARLLGQLFRRWRQPQVLGEMLAGIALGPSILGHWLPNVQATLFPPTTLAGLQGVSQVGLMLFMFLIGLELDTGLIRRTWRKTAVVSYMSIAVPFALGVTLALWLYAWAPKNVPFALFASFFGCAMSITAMPVLARILQERRLLKSPVGSMAMSCAAVNDVSAWIILTLIVWFARNDGEGVGQLLLVGAYAAAMLLVVRPLLHRYGERLFGGVLTQDRMALVLGIALLSALATEAIGIHALFGAFLAGAIMPRHTGFVDKLTHKLEDLTLVLMLPLFFAWSGLRTDLGLIDSPQDWLAAAAILLVAIVGKWGGCYFAARWCGMNKGESAIIGVLMNTRGLMELVILNIGLDIGIISPPLFTMMAFMAIITTAMTSPLLTRYLPKDAPRIPAASD